MFKREKKSDPADGVRLVTANDTIMAGIFEAMLGDNGIPVRRKYLEAGDYMQVVLGNALFGIDLYVPAECYVQAKELVDAYFAENPDAPEEGAPEDENSPVEG